MYTLCMVSERPMNLQDMNNCNILEVGAAGLLVGDMEAKMKGQHWKYFGTTEMPYLEQLLQPASVTMITNSVSARSHLRAITATKRARAGPQQIWYVFYCVFFCSNLQSQDLGLYWHFLPCKLLHDSLYRRLETVLLDFKKL